MRRAVPSDKRPYTLHTDRTAVSCGVQEGGQVEVVADPYGREPRRHSALIVRSAKPYSAETPKEILGEQLHTPNELFFVRHHLPVPHIQPEEYLLEVNGDPPELHPEPSKSRFIRVLRSEVW